MDPDEALAEEIEPGGAVGEPEPVLHLGMADVVHVADPRGLVLREQLGGLVRQGHLVVVEAALETERDAVQLGERHQVGERAPRPGERRGAEPGPLAQRILRRGIPLGAGREAEREETPERPLRGQLSRGGGSQVEHHERGAGLAGEL